MVPRIGACHSYRGWSHEELRREESDWWDRDVSSSPIVSFRQNNDLFHDRIEKLSGGRGGSKRGKVGLEQALPSLTRSQ